MATAEKLNVDTSVNADGMAEAMFGSGIKIISADYTGAAQASGTYSDADSTMPGVAPSDSGVILSTGKAKDITNSDGADRNDSAGTTTRNWTDGDEDLAGIAGMKTFDAAILEAEFVPQGSTLTMQVTFSSEEYLEYVDSGYNDAVGIWVNGIKAELTVGDGDISIDNINDEDNSNLYLDNARTDDTYNTEMDGLTVTMTLKAQVTPGEVNTIKIGIADAGDNKFDSNLMIAGDSVQSALIAADDSVDLKTDSSETLDVLSNDSTTVTPGTLSITKINGVDVEAGDKVTLPSGDVITLNGDGTLEIETDSDEGTNVFSYEVTDADGNTDVAFVEFESSSACFVAGTWIDTEIGPRKVEQIAPGDRVLTRDNGAQPVTWVGGSLRRAEGRDAPIHFAAGALGEHGVIELSPQHRVLIREARAELLFGEAEVLVKAKDLVNDTTIRRRADGSPVQYVHILFARHEIVTANGLPSESYHPGDQTLASFDAETRAEILRLAPGADGTGPGIGPAARPSLKAHEARVLR